MSVEFFCAAVRLLSQMHGPRTVPLAAIDAVNPVVVALAEAETAWLSLPRTGETAGEKPVQ